MPPRFLATCLLKFAACRATLPIALLLSLLQRTPSLPPASLAPLARMVPAAGAWLRCATLTSAALGPLHTLVGATVVNVAASPGLAPKVGDLVQLAATVTGSGVSFARAWDITGGLPPGLNAVGGVAQSGRIVVNPSDGVLVVRGTATAAGTYTFTLRGWHDGTLTGQNATTSVTINVAPAADSVPVGHAPAIGTPPATRIADVGETVTLQVAATGTAPLAYLWFKNGVALTAANSATLTLPDVQVTDTAAYTVTVTNAAGSATSAPAQLTVRPLRPYFSIQPIGQNLVPGQSLTLTANAAGATSYQWHRDGLPLVGATAATLTLDNIAPAAAGTYTVTATNTTGSTVSAPARITVSPTPIEPARLVNLAIRTRAGTGAKSLIMGFTLAGPATAAGKPLLLRAIGPTLTSFGLGGVLADPVISLYSGPTVIASNDNWSGEPQISAAAAQVGAFPLADPTSADAALHRNHIAGGYTLQISAATAVPGSPASNPGPEGLALAEIYDAMPLGAFEPTRHARLTNVSARTQVGTGSDILIAGFTLAGTGSRTLLIRAIGPTLASFGVAGSLTQPQLALYSGATLLQSNQGWADAPMLAATAASVGAFALPASSKDAALLVTLPPGGYTVQVSGAPDAIAGPSSTAAAEGVALVEIYEVP